MLPTIGSHRVKTLIHFVRGRRVMLDSDLATLYGVTTFNLNKAVRRNADRFPKDFMFRLTPGESANLIFQFGISRRAGHGGRRNLPHVFTQEGVAMLSSVIRSPRAVAVNIEIMRVFVRHRRILNGIPGMPEVLKKIEAELEKQGKIGAKNKRDIRMIFEIIQSLVDAPGEEAGKRIGLSAD